MDQKTISNAGGEQVRKIVKAKRHFKNNQNSNINVENEVTNTTDKKLSQFLKIHDAHKTPKGSNERRRKWCKENIERMSPNSFCANFVPTSSTSISPSYTWSTAQEYSSSSGNFVCTESTEEGMRPSLDGESKILPKKRRTYELETSVNDITVLKSASVRESTSKITLRRKWNKTDVSVFSNGTPSWLNSVSVQKAVETSTPIFSKSMNSSKATAVKKPKSNVKIPNFAAIHQKALEKMESINDYKKRKDERAQMLLLGVVPKKDTTIKTAPKKCLRFAANTSNKDKSLTFIPLPSTPMLKRIPKENRSSSMIVPRHRVDEKPSRTPMKVEGTLKRKDSEPKSGVKQMSSMESFPKWSNAESFRDKVLKTTDKTVRKVLGEAQTNTSNILQDLERKKMKTLKQPNDLKPNLCHKSVKDIVTNHRLKKNTVEKQRSIIKGVRSNKRFDLLMNMRKGK